MLRSAFALTLALLASSLALTASAVAAGDPTMPLSEVRAGMRCTGYSVIKGTALSPFDVTVQDVVSGDAAARSPRILITVSGPAVDATGLGQGFSGSPIYCPDAVGLQRIIGAVSESVGEYGGKLALATPIESILGEPVEPPLGARQDAALLASGKAIAAPLSISGLSSPVAKAVRKAAKLAHRTVAVAPAAPRLAFAPVTLRPGSAMAVGLSSGDVTAGAIGTVSYVDGDVVWSFGHPLDSVGRRALFLQDAYVYAVVNNPLGTEDAITYKLGAPGHDLGTLSGDGISAVVGRLGALPTRFPLQVIARDLDTGRLEVSDVSLADESAVGLPTGSSALSTVGPIAVAQAVYTVLGGAPLRQSGSMCVRFEVRERPAPLRFCNTYVGGAGGSADLAGEVLVSDFAAAAALIDAYDAGPLHVTKVSANLKLQRGLRQAFLVGVDGPSTVRRGRVVRLRARLRRAGGGVFTRTIEVRVPKGQPRGDYDLTLTGTPADDAGGSGGDELDLSDVFDFGGGSDEEGPTTLRGLSAAIAGLARYDGVTASFREPGSDPAEDEQDGPPQRRAYRDPSLRISGTVSLPVTVTASRAR